MGMKYWYEYEPFTREELEELIDRAEGLRDDNHKFGADYKIVCLELDIVLRKFMVLLLQAQQS